MYLICVAQSSVLKERNSKLIETILKSYYRNYHSLIASDEMIKLELVSVLRNQNDYHHDDGPVQTLYKELIRLQKREYDSRILIEWWSRLSHKGNINV